MLTTLQVGGRRHFAPHYDGYRPYCVLLQIVRFNALKQSTLY